MLSFANGKVPSPTTSEQISGSPPPSIIHSRASDCSHLTAESSLEDPLKTRYYFISSVLFILLYVYSFVNPFVKSLFIIISYGNYN